MMDLVMGLQTRRREHRNRQLSALIVNMETDVQAETSERWTCSGTSHDERIMTAMARIKAMALCNAKFCEH